jgi:DNA-binding transcriptional ArsR family regulator
MYSTADLERADRLAGSLRAVAHPARVLVLDAFARSELSPIELTRVLDRPEYNLGVVAYHVRRLAAAGIVELSATIPRRGAVEHRYTLTREGAALAAALDGLER